MNPVTFRLEAFEGPLDLLLHLISVNKLQIDDIPISDILEQYMAYLDGLAALDMEITSDFLVMAAQLVLIKSRLLLPRAPEAADEDPRMSLAQRLAAYQQFKEAAFLLRPMAEAGRDIIARLPSPPQSGGPYRGRHDAFLLLRAVSLLLNKEQPAPLTLPSAFSGAIAKKHVRIEDQARRILALLSAKGANGQLLSLSEAFFGITDRTTAVATFLALLDLCRTRHILLADDDTIASGDDPGISSTPTDEKEPVFA